MRRTEVVCGTIYSPQVLSSTLVIPRTFFTPRDIINRKSAGMGLGSFVERLPVGMLSQIGIIACAQKRAAVLLRRIEHDE